MLRSHKNSFRSNKKLLYSLVLVVLILIAAGVYWRIYIYKPASQVITTAGNIPQATHSTSTNTPPPPKKPSSSAQNTAGGGVDTNGQTSATTSPSQWITSKSGVITVEQPIANATLHSGDSLVGTAKVGTVNFRLSDTSVGQIATGTLQVVNGKFSGKLGFTPHSSTGELDVFSTDSKGVEFNEIQIAVKFY